MAFLDDIATYLGGFTLSDGTNTYTVRKFLQPDTPDTTITLMEYPAGPPIRAMGASISAPIRDRHTLSVLTRGPQKDYAKTRTAAEAVHAKLDFYFGTISSKKYAIKALYSPQILEQDRNARWQIRCDYLVECER